ncbi:MAG: imidazole glycerol phosphate synthase subunit HisH [Candidatus Omnitrophica bacterium]|nr:imidazole glycerol phosphate synthase subunit HisH [Candidatus Omnitrophota bacterium]
MIAVVDYGMGNLGSIANMLKKIGAEFIVTGSVTELQKADRLILPGVGGFDEGMKRLEASGLRKVLDTKVLADRTPVLGICLGMQLMTRRSQEGASPGLGWIEADTVKFDFGGRTDSLKIPHMGWNTVTPVKIGGIFAGPEESRRFYFLHSYHVRCDRPDDVAATATHGAVFTAAFQRGHIAGVQFHPERSHRFGLQLFRNFAGMGA